MKAYFLLALVGATLLSGCAYYDRSIAYTPVYSPPVTVAYVSPAYVAPPPGTLVLGAGAGTLQAP